jgi:S-adenosylmethionine:tRNA ribosyltransferase-isomerase
MTTGAVDAIRATRASGARVIPVGTTAARTIESYAAVVEDGGPVPERLETRLLITPGYRFRWIDGMMTNFHLPRSTLLAMAAALLPGDGVEALKRAYGHAIESGYRFYSFGDACLMV